MEKRKWLWIFIVAMVIVLTLAAGCAELPVVTQPTSQSTPQQQQCPPAPKAEGYLPLIKSFTVSPETAIEGQPTTLSWDVSDATTVVIKPDVGAVDSVALSGTKQVTPTRPSTYTLIATNIAGDVRASRTVNLTPPPLPPDLVVTHLWTTGAIMYFNVKNQGTGVSKACAAYLYCNGPRAATAYVQPLVAGEQRIEEFPNYTFPSASPKFGDYDYEFKWDLKICIDTENKVAESDETNNCLAQTWGPDWGPCCGTSPWQKPEVKTPLQLNYGTFPYTKGSITTK